MSHITKQQLIDLLAQIKVKNDNIINANMVSGIIIKNNDIGFALEFDEYTKNYYQEITEKAKALLSQITTGKISIVATNKSKNSETINSKKYHIPNIGKVIIVGSGKGGVGKSSTTIGLALAAKEKGFRVGIIDADINGPSIAHMFGLNTKPYVEDGKIVPLEKLGIKFLSMGNLVDSSKAIIWRSAMYGKALNQMIANSHWNDLDIIFIDVPPGTGDIHLTIAQNYHIDAAVVISAPQKIALLDVAKAIDMYNNLKIPIIGVVQNLIQPIDPKNNVKEFSKNMGLDFLGTIEFDSKIIDMLDTGIEGTALNYLSKKYELVLANLISRY